jgi:hypothetical protein
MDPECLLPFSKQPTTDSCRGPDASSPHFLTLFPYLFIKFYLFIYVLVCLHICMLALFSYKSDIYFSYRVQVGSGTHPSPSPMDTWSSLSGVKRPVCKTDHRTSI